MDALLNVPGVLWKDLGTKYEQPLTRSEDIVREAECLHTVSAHSMSTDLQEKVKGYHGIYRDDTNALLGVINREFPQLVQPKDSFAIMEPLLDDGSAELETAMSFKGGMAIMGVFRLIEPYKVLGDDMTHYLIVMNDHTKPDNKVAILQTPVRIVCANALSHAMSAAVYQARVPFFADYSANKDLSGSILCNARDAFLALNKKAETLVDMKLKPNAMDIVLDELYPFMYATSEFDSGHERANEAIEIQRQAFLDCMEVDNLQNFKGTGYQVYNALVDMNQHYFKSGERAYNLDAKLQQLPGIGTMDTEAAKIKKLLALLPKVTE